MKRAAYSPWFCALFAGSLLLAGCGAGAATPSSPAPASVAPPGASGAAAKPSATGASTTAAKPSAAGQAASKPASVAGQSSAVPASAAGQAASKPASTGGSAAPSTTVRLAVAGAGTDATLFIGIDKGYFAQQGLKVDTVRLNSSDMPAPLAAGQLDVGAGSFNVALVNAYERGLDLRMVADKARCLPGSGAVSVVVRKDLYDSGKVRGPKDFKGLTFGIQSVGSGSEIELDKFLKQGGLGINDVDRKSMTYADMAVAFANKSLDATSAPEPTPSDMVAKNLAVLVGKCGDYNPNGEISQVLYGPKFISDQPDAAKRFMVGYLQSARYFNDAFVKHNPAVLNEALDIISKETKTDAAVYKTMDASNDMWGVDPDGQVNIASLQEDQEFWANVTKELPKTADLSKLVDMSFAEAAVKQLGPYK